MFHLSSNDRIVLYVFMAFVFGFHLGNIAYLFSDYNLSVTRDLSTGAKVDGSIPTGLSKCDEKAFVSTPPIKVDGNLRSATEIFAFEALSSLKANEMHETRVWDNEAFDAVNDYFWGMEGGIILEIGGSDGMQFSVSKDFLPLHWHRILVEASPRSRDIGIQQSPDTTFIAATICNEKNVHYIASKNASDGIINGIAEFMSPQVLESFHKENFHRLVRCRLGTMAFALQHVGYDDTLSWPQDSI